MEKFMTLPSIETHLFTLGEISPALMTVLQLYTSQVLKYGL